MNTPRRLEIHTEPVETTTAGPDYRPDPNWTHTDRAGHVHRWIDGTLPTLVHHTADLYDAEEGDYTDTWWQCRECDDEVVPGYEVVPGTGHGFRTFVPGTTSYYIDGRPATKAEAEALIRDQGPR